MKVRPAPSVAVTVIHDARCGDMHFDGVVDWVGLLRSLPQSGFLPIDQKRGAEHEKQDGKEFFHGCLSLELQKEYIRWLCMCTFSLAREPQISKGPQLTSIGWIRGNKSSFSD